MSTTLAREMEDAHCFYLKWLRSSGLTESEIKKIIENIVQDFVITENKVGSSSNGEPKNNFMDDNRLYQTTSEHEDVSLWLDNLLNSGVTWKSLILSIFEENCENDRLKTLVSSIYRKEGKKLTHPSIVCTNTDLFIETIVDMILNSMKNGSISELAEIAAYSPFSYLAVQCLLKKIIPGIMEPEVDSQSFAILNRISIEVHEYVYNKYNYDCLQQMDLIVSSGGNFIDEQQQEISRVYLSLLQDNTIANDNVDKLYSYLHKNYILFVDNNYKLMDSQKESLFYEICSNRYLSKRLVLQLFSHLEITERDNSRTDLLIKTLALLTVCNNYPKDGAFIVDHLNEHIENIDEDMVSLEYIEGCFSETITLLSKLTESELSIIRFEDVSKILESPLKISSIAYGYMVWFQCNLEVKNFSDTTAMATMPYFFLLFDSIINLHMPILHYEVLVILKSILYMSFDHVEALTELKIKKYCMSSILYLMIHCDMMFEVYEVISSYKNSSTDTSLLFYFIRKFLKIIRPPFSTEFKKLWGPFLNSDDIQSGLRLNEKECVNFFLKHMA